MAKIIRRLIPKAETGQLLNQMEKPSLRLSQKQMAPIQLEERRTTEVVVVRIHIRNPAVSL